MGDSIEDFLKRRALDFLACAESDFERGRYSLVLFHVEQFLQLYLKHLLYRKIGDFPKTHSIIRLPKDLEFSRKALKVVEWLEKHS